MTPIQKLRYSLLEAMDEAKRIDQERIALIKEIMVRHSNRTHPDYMLCDVTPCYWCERARKAIEAETK